MLWLVLLIGLGAGCTSTEPGKFEEQVHHWVPIGTPEKEARRVMTRRGFDCDLVKQDSPFNRYGSDYLDCSRTQVWFHDWTVRIFLKDGKVSGYGPVRVE